MPPDASHRPLRRARNGARRSRRRPAPHRPAAPEPGRAPPPGRQGRPGVLRGVDAVLISHLHYDHLDLPSLQRLGPEMPVVAPHGAGALIRRKAGSRTCSRCGPGEQIEIGARHGAGDTRRARLRPAALRRSRRAARLRDRGRRPLGLLRRRHRRVRRDGRPRTGRRRAAADLGLGADDGAGAHGSGSALREAAALVGARVAIPIHWGTYYPIHLGLQGPPGFLKTPPAHFEQAIRELAPATEVRVLQPGEEAAI